MELRDQIKLELLEMVNKGQVNTSYLDKQSLLTSSEAQIVRSGLHTDGCFNIIPNDNGSYDYMISSLGIREMIRLKQIREDERIARETKMYQHKLAKHQAETHIKLYWVAI